VVASVARRIATATLCCRLLVLIVDVLSEPGPALVRQARAQQRACLAQKGSSDQEKPGLGDAASRPPRQRGSPRAPPPRPPDNLSLELQPAVDGAGRDSEELRS